MTADTHPAALACYRARLRALGPAERLEIAAGLSRSVRDLAEAGIRRRHPGASDDEVRCRIAALLYGRDAARRLFGRLADDL